jgi:hypothetical protein
VPYLSHILYRGAVVGLVCNQEGVLAMSIAKLLTVSAMLFFIGPAIAADWATVFSNTKTTIWIDRASLRKEEKIVIVWMRQSFSSAQKLPDGIPYFAATSLTRINCEERTTATEYAAFYDPSFTNVLIHPKTQTQLAMRLPLDYDVIIPGTSAEAIMNFVC